MKQLNCGHGFQSYRKQYSEPKARMWWGHVIKLVIGSAWRSYGSLVYDTYVTKSHHDVTWNFDTQYCHSKSRSRNILGTFSHCILVDQIINLIPDQVSLQREAHKKQQTRRQTSCLPEPPALKRGSPLTLVYLYRKLLNSWTSSPRWSVDEQCTEHKSVLNPWVFLHQLHPEHLRLCALPSS